MVYPTLTLLEEEGYAMVSSTEGNKKLYAATEEGKKYLKDKPGHAEGDLRTDRTGRKSIWARTFAADQASHDEPEVALKMRVGRGDLNPEQVGKIAQAIDAAARAIDEV